MKKFLLVFAFVLPMVLLSQNTSGVVTYAEVVLMKWTPPADMDAAMRAQIEQMMKNGPKSFTNYKELTFDSEVAYYKISPKQDSIDAARVAKENMEGGGPGGGGGYRRMMSNNKGVHYWELKKGKYLDKREFFEKEFLIKDEPKKLTWKILGEAKQIAGFVCQKAATMVDTTQVIAWFCPTIPVSVGPNGWGQLPGMILEIAVDERTTITAEKIDLKAVNTKEIEAPKGGKVVTKDEYDLIVKEKMEEMRAEWKARSSSGGGHGGGPVIIRSGQ